MSDTGRLQVFNRWTPFSSVVLCLFLGCGGGAAPVDESAADVPADASSEASFDACNVVTAVDATALFGVEASQDSGMPTPDPNLIGECLWSHDTETSSHLLQFRVWNGENYYGSPPDGTAPEGSQPTDLGDGGHVWARAGTLVDVEWIQGGKTVSLSYSTVGTDVGGAEKVEEVKTLAAKVSEQVAAL